MDLSGTFFPKVWTDSANQPITTAILLLCFLTSIAYILQKEKKQEYANAPIAGIAKAESLKHARERFITQAREMIWDGYRRVGDSCEEHP